MARRPDPSFNNQFKVGWIYALPTELAAAEAILN